MFAMQPQDRAAQAPTLGRGAAGDGVVRRGRRHRRRLRQQDDRARRVPRARHFGRVEQVVAVEKAFHGDRDPPTAWAMELMIFYLTVL